MYTLNDLLYLCSLHKMPHKWPPKIPSKPELLQFAKGKEAQMDKELWPLKVYFNKCEHAEAYIYTII